MKKIFHIIIYERLGPIPIHKHIYHLTHIKNQWGRVLTRCCDDALRYRLCICQISKVVPTLMDFLIRKKGLKLFSIAIFNRICCSRHLRCFRTFSHLICARPRRWCISGEPSGGDCHIQDNSSRIGIRHWANGFRTMSRHCRVRRAWWWMSAEVLWFPSLVGSLRRQPQFAGSKVLELSKTRPYFFICTFNDECTNTNT